MIVYRTWHVCVGVFTTDLTLAEVKTLRARQQFPERDQSYNGRFQVPTLEEYIALAKVRDAGDGVVPRAAGMTPWGMPV